MKINGERKITTTFYGRAHAMYSAARSIEAKYNNNNRQSTFAKCRFAELTMTYTYVWKMKKNNSEH